MQPFSIPDLLSSINSLTLELFSLRYPPGFLSELGRKLGHLDGLMVYSQLFAGMTEEYRRDAVAFIENQEELKEVYFLDAVCQRVNHINHLKYYSN
jgi:hypothetical protein